MRIRLTCAAILVAAATPAGAQEMTGHLDPQLYANVIMQMNQGNNTCGPMSQSEIDEARLPAPGIMQAYFDAAQAGEPISPHFKLTSRTSWVARGIRADRETLDAQRDPLAVPGNRFLPDTLRFFRAGTHQTAQGQWLVLAADGSVAGVYTAVFERQRGEWRLLQLEVYQANDRVMPITHYCTQPGDLELRRIEGLTSVLGQARDRVESRTRRLTRAEERLDVAEARAAERPDSSSRARRVSERRATVADRRSDLAEAQSELREAQGNLQEALSELTELRQNATLARNAGSFRQLDDDGRRGTSVAAKTEETQQRLDAKR